MKTMVNAQEMARGTNKAFEYSIKTTASPEEIWTVGTSVSNWRNWDTGLKEAEWKEAFRLLLKNGTVLICFDLYEVGLLNYSYFQLNYTTFVLVYSAINIHLCQNRAVFVFTTFTITKQSHT